MEIKFDKAPTELFIKNIGDRSDSKISGYSVYYDAETHDGESITVLSHELYKPTTQFVRGVVGNNTLYVPVPTYHKLKGGSAAPEKPSQDAKYTGAQPTPPAQQAAEKPKEAPATIPLGVTPVTVEPSGAYKNQPMILTATPCAPTLNSDGTFVRDNLTKQPKWAVRVQGDAIPKGVIAKVFGEADKDKPPLQPGKQLLYVSREENKNKPGQFWYEVSAKPQDGKGNGGARIDVELSIICAIGGNPNIKREDWLEAAKKLREDYYTLKGAAK